MSLAKCSGHESQLYLAFLNVPNFEYYKQFFKDGEELKIVFQPPPVKKEQIEKEQCNRLGKGDAIRWRRTFMPDEFVNTTADLVSLIQRPTSMTNTEAARDMPSQKVYIKMFPSGNTIKDQQTEISGHVQTVDEIGLQRQFRGE